MSDRCSVRCAEKPAHLGLAVYQNGKVELAPREQTLADVDLPPHMAGRSGIVELGGQSPLQVSPGKAGTPANRVAWPAALASLLGDQAVADHLLREHPYLRGPGRPPPKGLNIKTGERRAGTKKISLGPTGSYE